MVLISRQANIAANLLNNPHIYQVKDLAKKYKVSVRTLRNDLKKIAEWLNGQPGCQYNTKPGKGIWISCTSDDNRKKAVDSLQLCESEGDIVTHYLSPNQRKWKLLTELAFTDEYLTGKKLAKMLDVSANTFLADLANAKKEAKKFNLDLIGKNYYGYCLDGTEIDLRSLMEYILQKHINRFSYNTKNLLEMITKIMTKSPNNSYLPVKIGKLLNYVALILVDQLPFTKSLNSSSDLSIVKSMINRLTIILVENQRHRYLNTKLYDRKLNSKQESYSQIYHLVSKIFGLKPIKSEEKYFIFGVNLSEKRMEINEIVEKVISFVSEKTNLPLTDDLQLRDSLSQHLFRELNTNYQHASEYTPFTEEVKNRFNSLFEIVKEALEKYISKSPIIIEDTFITLVSLHFLISIIDMAKVKPVKVLYVCSSGLGATRLLEKIIEKRIPYVVSAGFASVVNYQLKIRELNPDLVISIFPLEKVKGTMIVQVNPIPNERDLSLIEKKLGQVVKEPSYTHGVQIKNVLKKEKSISLTDKVLSICLEAFIEISNYFSFRINQKYQKAFMIHVQLATERIYFNEQYDIRPSEHQIKKFAKEDITKIKEIYHGLNLEINISEVVAILRYTLLK